MKDAYVSFNPEEPHVIINGINFGKAVWEIINLNISITNSNTNSLTLNVRSKPMQNSSHLNVENSKLGYCIFEGISVKMTNCSFTGGYYADSLLTILDSYVIFEKIRMSNINYTTTLILVRSSSMALRDSDFFNNNMMDIEEPFEIDLILILNKSNVIVETCHFWGNSGLNIGSETSFLRVKNSLFTNNTGKITSGLKGYESRISIDNSTFTGNSAGTGIAISMQRAAALYITNSYFSENYALQNGGAIVAFDNSTVIVSHTVFESNRADESGGAMWLSYLNRFICSDCHFFNNSAKGAISFVPASSGAIYIENSQNVKLSMISFNSNKGSAITFRNCTNVHVADSLFQNNSTPFDGGAVSAFKSEAIFRNGSFTKNNAKGNGGAVNFFSSSMLTFSESVFSKNIALNQGGGILSQNSKLIIYNSAFYSNSAVANAGGAIITKDGNYHRDLKISNCTFYGHTAGDGGSIDISENIDALLTQCTFIGNLAVGDGGAIRLSNSKIDLSNSTFINNSGSEGGVLNSLSSKIKITLCNFQNNMATRRSGGILFGRRNTDIFIKHSFISNNSALLTGGGVAVTTNSTLSIRSSQLYNNSAGTQGGALSSYESNSSIIVDHCLFRNNTGQTGGAIAVEDSDIFLEKCVFEINRAHLFGGAISTDYGMLRISQTVFSDDVAPLGSPTDIWCDIPNPLPKAICDKCIKTYISEFKQQNTTGKSSDKYFTQIVFGEEMISFYCNWTGETHYASGNF